MSEWTPHKPETWPWRYGRLKADQTFRVWEGARQDAKGEPIMVERIVPAGTKVKITMVSRFGDVGITDNLNATNGYHSRVLLDDLERCTP